MAEQTYKITDLPLGQSVTGEELVEAVQDGKSVRLRVSTLSAAGKSAYQIARDQGYGGDEAGWLASLRGPVGNQGSQGTQGIQGVQGAVGPIGPVGVAGQAGAPGVQGIPGEAGPQGVTGPRGTQGPQGIQGPVGPVGSGLRIKGSGLSTAQFPKIPAIGDGWLVKDHLWIYIEGGWYDSGLIVNSAEMERLRTEAVEAAGVATTRAREAQEAAHGMELLENAVDQQNQNIQSLLRRMGVLDYRAPLLGTLTVDGELVKTIELGALLANVVLRWTLDGGVPTAQRVSPPDTEVPVGTVTKTLVGPFAGNRTWSVTVSGTDPAGNVREQTATASLQVRQKRYWGVVDTATLTSPQILALASEFATSRVKTLTYNASAGGYPYFAYPASWGALGLVTVGGLVTTDWVESIQTFTNASGYSENYRVIRFARLQHAAALVVAWS